MKISVAILAGDGIGPEIMSSAVEILERTCPSTFEFREALVGGAAFDQFGSHFPAETEQICRDCRAILFGSVGGPVAEMHLPKWHNCEANSILAIRKRYQFHANLRPMRIFPALQNISPLRDRVLGGGIDILIIRELLGDLYFGAHTLETINGVRTARDVCEYDEAGIARIARTAFTAARQRSKRVTSVDKANVLATSKLWRAVVHEVHGDFPDIALEDMLVDNCAMQLIQNPSQFDVLLTPNMFGDILSDAGSVIPGSLGLTPSASLNAEGFGLYEPAGGSAPNIAGQNIANPIAQILSAALMLRLSFQMEQEALRIEQAVEAVLAAGVRTKDIAEPGTTAVGTTEFTRAVLERL